MPDTAPVQLSYGRQAPTWRRRKIVFPALLLIPVIVGVWLSWSRVTGWYERWSNRREIAAWYAKAQTWSEPATKLKYTENPADAPGRKFLRSYGRTGGTTFTGYKAFGETPMERLPYFDDKGQLFLAYIPDEAMLFLHARTTSAGLTRLIAIDRPAFEGNLLRLNVSQVGPFNGEYRIIRAGAQMIDMTGICGSGEIRLYAGQPDASDPAKLSISFEARGRKGWIDGVFAPGESYSKNPKDAAVEQETNSGVVFTVRMAAVPTSQPATTRAAG